ncbi:MAG: NAD(P)H-hydrate dehydratase, partial [Pseudomonas sp.]|nr:NAD(P)H-hydrate dehydratase [Pseudomonas sp.]
AGELCGAAGRGLAASDLLASIGQLLEECSPCLG